MSIKQTNKTGGYAVNVKHQGQSYHVGVFDSEEVARLHELSFKRYLRRGVNA